MMQEFVDQINKTARSATDDMHTALPGEIKSYDPGKGVATVLPKAKFTKPDGSTMDFPEISGVPVMFPQSKNVTIACQGRRWLSAGVQRAGTRLLDVR